MSDRHPWDIYADSLFHLGFGYPVWKPDPAPGCGEVDIGDVGWLENGEFHKLFNTTKAPDDPQPRGIPDGYRTFDVERAFIHGPREEIQQSVLCSRSIERLDASAGLTAAPSSLPSFTFECSDDSGAMLVLHPSAVSKDIKSRKHVVAYIQSHFPEWMEFANGRFGLVLKDEQLMFVCGTTKTSRWAVAAFHGSYCKKQGSISANLSSTFAFDFSLAIANVQLPAAFYRVGPPQNGTHSSIPGRAMSDVTRDISWTQRDALNNDPLSHKFDQCIFIHYFKAKRRTFLPLQVLRAGAGPDQLPPGSDDIRDGKTPITAHHTMPDRGEAEYELFPPSQKVWAPSVQCHSQDIDSLTIAS
ncbi:hypothetical protein BD311DRAFT_669637 [Dichomitus squalens]|uniref:Uncharacterized protein n=1 Tax=Dichomitus squalens TaxID=114155 RepID=A0A4Q9MFV7_9APHY|nr:hypothetical protein BD311DRAFT_669637 [Dichomitus squalens]